MLKIRKSHKGGFSIYSDDKWPKKLADQVHPQMIALLESVGLLPIAKWWVDDLICNIHSDLHSKCLCDDVVLTSPKETL